MGDPIRSGPRLLSSFVLISSPSETARLASTSAATPAARLVIQKRSDEVWLVTNKRPPAATEPRVERVRDPSEAAPPATISSAMEQRVSLITSVSPTYDAHGPSMKPWAGTPTLSPRTT